MKLFLIIIALLSPSYIYAVGINNGVDINKWEQLIEATEYSAKFVGYSSYCHANVSDTDFIHNWFINIVLPKSNLSESNLKDIKTIYYKMVVKSKTNGPVDSNLNCEIFATKLKDLKSAIKSGVATNINSQKQSNIIMSEDIRKYIEKNKQNNK